MAKKEKGGVAKTLIVNADDIKSVKTGDDGVVVEIKKKRRGKYGHRGKDGSRFFGRETIIQEYD